MTGYRLTINSKHVIPIYVFFPQITLKKISLTALPSNGDYGTCIEEPDAQYVQGETVIARHELIPIEMT